MSPWIPLVLVAIALSPLAALLPSRRQRGQMDVRLQARRMGVAMQLMPQDWPHWLAQLPPSPCPQYHSARRGRQDSWCYWQGEPGQWLNKWREPCEDGALLAQLLELPADVFKVEASTKMVALCWGERGGEEALQRIADFLQLRA
ncbi:hypothetical protein [Pseudomonas sp. EA_105y_Pfl2_R69]|uniref:hypothetical protein n=1 Tax=Pseudomonas sp. EA_105y_Pfl2_R69 TaxID=3088683 RepID=UPI0030DA15CA